MSTPTVTTSPVDTWIGSRLAFALSTGLMIGALLVVLVLVGWGMPG